MSQKQSIFARAFDAPHQEPFLHFAPIGQARLEEQVGFDNLAILYRFYQSPLKHVGTAFGSAAKFFTSDARMVGIYYDPPTVPPAAQRWAVGVVSADLKPTERERLSEAGYRAFTIGGSNRALAVDFDFRPRLALVSVLAMVWKAYPAMKRMAAAHELKVGPALELYGPETPNGGCFGGTVPVTIYMAIDGGEKWRVNEVQEAKSG